MKFEPLDKNGRKLFSAGIYDFEVMEATETKSSSGNEMIKLRLKINDGYGGNITVFDHLVSATASMCRQHIKGFAHATGLDGKYEKGEIYDTDCLGKSGKCELTIERNEAYGDRNKIEKYISKHRNSEHEIVDDDVPF